MDWLLRFVSNLLFSACFFAATSSGLLGVVISDGDGSSNTTPPVDDPGFANVGIMSVGSGIYLGNRWVLTAAHVGAATISLDGADFMHLADETVRLKNPVGSLSPQTDLILLRLAEDPQLPALRLGCHGVRFNTEVTLIGGGRDREAELSYWDRDEGPGKQDDVWMEVTSASQANERGYFTRNSRTVRWGPALVSATNFDAGDAHGDVLSFRTHFLQPGRSVESSSQAVRGDSGGAVFQKNAGVWELVGMIHAIGGKENQPRNTDTAIFGGWTFSAELADYADQIRAVADFEPHQGDFDGDGIISAAEIDQTFAAIKDRSLHSCHTDLTGNGMTTHQDIDRLLEEIGALRGDADLDGSVDFSDFLALARGFGDTDVGWSDGDFDGDRSVTFGDFLLLSLTYGESIDTAVSSVPEPTHNWAVIVIAMLVLRRRRNARCCVATAIVGSESTN